MKCRGIFRDSSKILLIHNAVVLDLEDSFIMGYGQIDKALLVEKEYVSKMKENVQQSFAPIARPVTIQLVLAMLATKT